MQGRPRRNEVPEDKAEEIVEAYTVDHISLSKLCKHFDVTQYVMTHFLIDHDVDIRPRGRIRKMKKGTT